MKIQRGSLFLADLNPRFGSEAGKMRPVLVIQTDLLNEILHPSTTILPCTTNLKPENILRVRLPQKIAGNQKNCEVMIDQARSIDNKRFAELLGHVPDLIFKEVLEKLMAFLEIN